MARDNVRADDLDVLAFLHTRYVTAHPVGQGEILSSTTTVPAARRRWTTRCAAGRRSWRPGRHRPARPPPWPWWPRPLPAGRRRRQPGRRCAAWSSCRSRPAPARPAGSRPPRPAPERRPLGPRPIPGRWRAPSRWQAPPSRRWAGRPGLPSRPVCGPRLPGGRRSTIAPGVPGLPRRQGSDARPGRSRRSARPWQLSRPPTSARPDTQRCSTASARVKRADREHDPVSGSTRAALTSSQPGAPKPERSPHTARSRSAPVASPTCAASPCQRPASRLGVSERSLAVLVASDASRLC